MKSSLIPDKPLLLHPSLAATIGLEEAVLLSVLADVGALGEAQERNGYCWLDIACDCVCEAAPFWQPQDIARVANSLRDKGILLMGASEFGASSRFKFAYNEALAQATKQRDTTCAPRIKTPIVTMNQQAVEHTGESQRDEIEHPFGKNYLGANWRPSSDTLTQLAQHGIPEQFALQHVPTFITYWRERKEAHRSWGSKFIQHVMFKWRDYEAKQVQRDQNTAMTASWQPSADAMDVLTRHAGISREFIEDAVPEFVLYWQERGDVAKTWNSKFIQHVRMQWNKFTRAVEHHTEPHPIPDNWQPSNDVFDVLRLANIDIAFATQLLPEFLLYWKDTNQIHHSWNTRFLQHVKRHWAKGLGQQSTSSAHSTNADKRSTREISIEEQLNDRSWAV